MRNALVTIVAAFVLTGIAGCGFSGSANPAGSANSVGSANSAERDKSAGSDKSANGAGSANSSEGVSAQAPSDEATEEFGMTKKELVQAIEKVEGLIAKCMAKQGFEYIAADFKTVRKGMQADKREPGMSEREFIERNGFGVATRYTGKPPQLVDGYSPAKVGLGEQNIRIFQKLSPQDQVAYNRALFGENTDASFAVGLETENFSRCGGCTLEAIKQVFKPEQLKASYYNPIDAKVRNHKIMKEAVREYQAKMSKAGYQYNHPDEVEPDIRDRLAAITGGGTIPVEKLSPEQQAQLKALRAYELKVAKLSFELQSTIIDPAEEKVQKELFARDVK